MTVGDWIRTLTGFWHKVISFGQTDKEEGLIIVDELGFFVCIPEVGIQDHDPGIETDDDKEYIEIDGEKWSKDDIKKKLKEKDDRIDYLEDMLLKFMNPMKEALRNKLK